MAAFMWYLVFKTVGVGEMGRVPWFDTFAAALFLLVRSCEAEEAVKQKQSGNKAFQEKRYDAALEAKGETKLELLKRFVADFCFSKVLRIAVRY